LKIECEEKDTQIFTLKEQIIELQRDDSNVKEQVEYLQEELLALRNRERELKDQVKNLLLEISQANTIKE